MKIHKSILIVVYYLSIASSSIAQEVLQWRGVDRNGVFNETNLLKKWPDAGPNLLWESDDIGNGYGSPVITKTNIYVNGEKDTICYLFCLDLSGKIKWKSEIGKEWVMSYPGARTTPTIVGDLIYVTTGMGIVACFETNTGTKKWSVDMIKDFHGRNTRFGFSESVLVDENKVFCMPGSSDTNVVALDRFTGKIIWISKGLGQKPSFCSPLLIKLHQRNVMVTFSRNALLGIDTEDGKLLWSHSQEGEGDVHVNTPLFENGFIYYITGNGNGTVKLKLADDGTSVTQIWVDHKCDDLMGGFIKVNDYIYSASYEKRYYYIVDANKGTVTDSLKFDHGTINYADGLLYLYNEKGQLGLCIPKGPKMELISSFKVTKGTKAHYSHPVILNGILYLRHGKSLLAYDIKGD